MRWKTEKLCVCRILSAVEMEKCRNYLAAIILSYCISGHLDVFEDLLCSFIPELTLTSQYVVSHSCGHTSLIHLWSLLDSENVAVFLNLFCALCVFHNLIKLIIQPSIIHPSVSTFSYNFTFNCLFISK